MNFSFQRAPNKNATRVPRHRFTIRHVFILTTFVATFLASEIAIETSYFGKPIWAFVPFLVHPPLTALISFPIWGRTGAWIGGMLGLLVAAEFASATLSIERARIREHDQDNIKHIAPHALSVRERVVHRRRHGRLQEHVYVRRA